jgi:hypothetical protein
MDTRWRILRSASVRVDLSKGVLRPPMGRGFAPWITNPFKDADARPSLRRAWDL